MLPSNVVLPVMLLGPLGLKIVTPPPMYAVFEEKLEEAIVALDWVTSRAPP